MKTNDPAHTDAVEIARQCTIAVLSKGEAGWELCAALIEPKLRERDEEIQKLNAQLATARRDSVLLDFLETEGGGCNFGPRDNPSKAHCWIETGNQFPNEVKHFYGDTYRDAIHAARQTHKEEGKTL